MKSFQRISKGFQTYFTKEHQVVIFSSIKVFFHVLILPLSLNSYLITLSLRDAFILVIASISLILVVAYAY